MNGSKQRIVCLSAEAADWLWRIGAWENVVGVSAFFEQSPGIPPKPRISGFSAANIGLIHSLKPTLIITFSDVQAELSAELIRKGYLVVATNQRTLAEIEETLALLARIVHRESEGTHLLNQFQEHLAPVEYTGHRPRVYFEEWNEPLISGIGWIGELIERAGGTDIFPDLGLQRSAQQRVVTSEQVLAADPEIILTSWCGKPVNVAEISSRPGWNTISAVLEKRILEIPGNDILQPGFRLIQGYSRICRAVREKIEATGIYGS